MRNLILCAALLAAAACTNNEPVYIDSPNAIEVGVGSGTGADMGSDTLNLPYDQAFLTSTDYQAKQAELVTSINAAFDPDITADQLPLVHLDQTAIEVEWSIKNLDDTDGTARIGINGGNQFFYYVPADFTVASPNPEDQEVPPPLVGNIPINVPALGEVSGVYREDELREAAVDLELMTRCALSPFAAILNNDSAIHSCADVPFIGVNVDPDNPAPPPPPLPIEAFGQFVRLDVNFQASGHMVLEYSVRVRDPDGVLHEKLLAAPAGELMAFTPAEFIPPPPVAP
jgi:hypothetical protein